MKRKLQISLLLLLQMTFLMAQGFDVRECFENEIPLSKRADYYKQAHRIIENHYMLLLESVGESENREVIIEQMMSDKSANTLKAEFLLNPNKASSFCTPQQYFTKFEFVYKDLVDKVVFVVDNYKDGKIMMNSLVSCYIPVVYDLTLQQDGETLFKRRCRMYCLFPKANASKLVKVMQIEPLEDIIAYNKTIDCIDNVSPIIIINETDNIHLESFTNDIFIIAIFIILGGLYIILYKYLKLIYLKALLYIKTFIFNLRGIQTRYNNTDNYIGSLQYEIAELYYSCKKYNKAVEWFSKAADKNNSKAQNDLGCCYAEGKGVQQSYEKAFYWFMKSANLGTSLAIFNVGECYEKGQGVPQSYEKAVEWYTKAAKQGLAGAKKALERLKNKQ